MTADTAAPETKTLTAVLIPQSFGSFLGSRNILIIIISTSEDSLTILCPMSPPIMLRTMLPAKTAAEYGSPTAPDIDISAKETTPATLVPVSRKPAAAAAAKAEAAPAYFHVVISLIFNIHNHLAKIYKLL